MFLDSCSRAESFEPVLVSEMSLVTLPLGRLSSWQASISVVAVAKS
jgi:hypothetical protein